MQNARNWNLIASVQQDISTAREENERDILFIIKNNFHISRAPCMLFCWVSNVKPLPVKNIYKENVYQIGIII